MPNVDTSKKFDSVAIYRIRKLLSDLSNKTGRGTELVSLYLPPKKAIHEAIAALREESGTASNIKSDVTRNHVQDALTKTIARLRLYKQTPENGLVIFCGAIPGPGGPGNETIELFEVLPQKPVTTYLYRCVAPDSKVLLQDETHKTIDEIKHHWKDVPIKSTKNGCKEVTESKVIGYAQTMAGNRDVYRLTSESGRVLVATEDHPLLTPEGWKTLASIKPGELVSVYPADDLDPPSEGTGATSTQGSKVIVNESTIRNLEHPSASIEFTLRQLKSRGLLPLQSDNPKLPIIARILGHLFSDGSVTHNFEIKKKRTHSYVNVDICASDEYSVAQIRSDIESLGCTAHSSFKTTPEIDFEGRTCTVTTIHIKLLDSAFCTLLRALGAPTGSKVKLGTRIPKWLFDAPTGVQREFLASLMGGDGEAPSILDSNPASRPRLTFHRIESLRDQGVAFARDISSLFERFGIKINLISTTKNNTRKKGPNTVEIELRFSLTEENILRILHSIGYRYSKQKMQSGLLFGEYLRIKSHTRALASNKYKTTIQMRTDGRSNLQIAADLDLPANAARAWSDRNMILPLARSFLIQDFQTWHSLAKHTPDEILVWENVESIDKLDGIQDVRDITVESEDHSFFANGFMVHNCDDHFHIEPLREMLREQNVIGVLAVDSTDAGLGIVSGDSWEVVDTMSSGVSGKTRKGGQCVSTSTLVQLKDGRLVPISQVTEGTRIVSYDFKTSAGGFYECADKFALVPKDYYEIKTIRPEMKIKATGEHRFFTLRRGGVRTIQAHELQPGDRLLVVKGLPEPDEVVLDTHFPAVFKHHIDQRGRNILVDEREKRGFTQEALAKAIGLIRMEISQLERGERTPAWEKLQEILRFLFSQPDDFNMKHVSSRRLLPEYFSPELLQLFGYILGDGWASKNGITLYEERKEVVDLYERLAEESLQPDYVSHRLIDKTDKSGSCAKRSHYEATIHSKIFVDALRKYYPGLISTELREIPEQIHRLDNAHLSHFLRGLFDAEGYVRKTKIGIAMTSGLVIRQLQLLLLRFGIISSYSQNLNRSGTRMHNLAISDQASIASFRSDIGFSAEDKWALLQTAARQKQYQSYFNVPVLNSSLDKIAKERGIKCTQFPEIANFFHDLREINPNISQRAVDKFELELSTKSKEESKPSILQQTVEKNRKTADSNLVLAHVSKVERKKNNIQEKFIDVELPVTKSFIGNGFVLHNSARRYERLREMELTDYFNRLADHAKKSFIEQYQIKGLVVSGPGPTKDEFVKDKYLDYRLQNLIIGTLDTGYAGREGVRETIEKAGKLLEDVRVIEEKKLVQRFFREVNSDTGLAVYGVKDVIAALRKAAVDTIIINDDVGVVYLKGSCNKCRNVEEKFVQRFQIVSEKQALLTCVKCGSAEVEIIEKDIVDYLAELAVDSGANVEVISSKTEDGAMMKNFGGISAILRYRA